MGACSHVIIGTAATLLGPIRVGDHVRIGAEAFVIMHDIPDNCTVVGAPGYIVKLNGKRVHKKLNPSVMNIDNQINNQQEKSDERTQQ